MEDIPLKGWREARARDGRPWNKAVASPRRREVQARGIVADHDMKELKMQGQNREKEAGDDADGYETFGRRRKSRCQSEANKEKPENDGKNLHRATILDDHRNPVLTCRWTSAAKQVRSSSDRCCCG